MILSMRDQHMVQKMINNLRVLAIVPARAGSKRVKDKNIRELGGKPLIAWTLESLKKSKYLDDAFVSTDSIQIQGISEEYGIDCHPLRPAELATDTASINEVVLDVIKHKKFGFDIILLLQPTSPFRTAQDIDEALELLIRNNANSVISVCVTDVHPSWTLKLGDSLDMRELVENINSKRSQDLEKFYRLNGAIYAARLDEIRKAKSFYIKEKTLAHIMKRLDSIDIDSEEDFYLAKLLMSDRI